MVKKVKSQLKAHVFDPSSSIYIVWFCATSKLSCDTNDIYESAAMWILPFLIKNTLETKLNRHISAAASITPVFTSVNSTETLL